MNAPENKLRELCDADHRRTHPTVQALAAGIIAGAPMPDPHAHHDSFHEVIDAARRHLTGQPTARTLRAAGRHLTFAITQMADAEAKRLEEKGEQQ